MVIVNTMIREREEMIGFLNICLDILISYDDYYRDDWLVTIVFLPFSFTAVVHAIRLFPQHSNTAAH